MKLLFVPMEQGQAGWPEGAIQAERDLGDPRQAPDCFVECEISRYST
jgi:hypothetical protein